MNSSEDDPQVPALVSDVASEPIQVEEVEPDEIAEKVAQIKQEIDLNTILEFEPDRFLLEPARWINANLAWIAGLLFVFLIALRLLVFAHFDTNSMAALVDDSNVQSISIQLIPYILPILLFGLLNMASIRLAPSRSIWAIPVFVTLLLISVLLVVTVTQTFTSILSLATFAVITFFYGVHVRRARNAWYEEAAKEHAERFQRRKRKMLKEIRKARKVVAGYRARIESELSAEDLSAERAGDLRSAMEELEGLENRIQEAVDSIGSEESLIDRVVMEHKDEPDPQPGRIEKLVIGGLNDAQASRRLTLLMTIMLSIVMPFTVLVLLGAAMTAPPWLPARSFTLKTGQHLIGYELAQTNATTTIISDDSRKVLFVDTGEIKAEAVCLTPGESPQGTTWGGDIFGVHTEPRYPDCEMPHHPSPSPKKSG